ncbi:MAG: ChaN family lipoprotein [Acidobacteriia bacterium]|nr:ChaN family lipoprotein [Terriglobia bacterium]
MKFAVPLVFAMATFAQVAPQPAIPAIVKAFDTHPVVAIGESHGLREAGDFYIALIRDPAFQSKVNNIVIEFASRRSQPVVDRYINGENVPPPELAHIWRDTTKVFGWESPIYRDLLAAVREVNRSLPPARRLRVLAGDAPIDWKRVTTNEQWGEFQPNNESFAKVIDDEVLAKRRRALVILGSNHLTKGGDRDRDQDTTTLVEQKYPHSMFVALLIYSAPNDARQQMAAWTPPALFPVAGTWVAPLAYGKRQLSDSADAILYLGLPLKTVDPDWSSYANDPDYMKELDRRSRIEWGCGFDQERWKKHQRPCP